MKMLFYQKQVLVLLMPLVAMLAVFSQSPRSTVEWIRPTGRTSPSIWGIRNGIVVGLWPYSIENTSVNIESPGIPFGGGPRGLLRVGYEVKGKVNMINFLAIEPVVKGNMEFSEISPSKSDNHWGKLMWAADNEKGGFFAPFAQARGIIDHPDPLNPAVERLSFYVFIEKFANGAYPYFKLFIRSDRPDELGIEIFQQNGSSKMERCAISATMGNYARLRYIHLEKQMLNSLKLYSGYDDIHFVEKESYPYSTFSKNKNGDLIVAATTDESFEQLANWPQTKVYEEKWNWRYRPFFKLVQYWRKEHGEFDPSLHLRVNGRAYYWAGGSPDKANYARIPNGVAFENFELREHFYPGQKFYFGLTRKSLEELLER